MRLPGVCPQWPKGETGCKPVGQPTEVRILPPTWPTKSRLRRSTLFGEAGICGGLLPARVEPDRPRLDRVDYEMCSLHGFAARALRGSQLGCGLDCVGDAVLVGEWATEHDEAFVHEPVPEGSVRGPSDCSSNGRAGSMTATGDDHEETSPRSRSTTAATVNGMVWIRLGLVVFVLAWLFDISRVTGLRSDRAAVRRARARAALLFGARRVQPRARVRRRRGTDCSSRRGRRALAPYSGESRLKSRSSSRRRGRSLTSRKPSTFRRDGRLAPCSSGSA